MSKQAPVTETPAPKLFKVAPGKTIWHSGEDKYYYEGETVDLSHLSDSNIAAVLNSRAIVEIKKEVTDG